MAAGFSRLTSVEAIDDSKALIAHSQLVQETVRASLSERRQILVDYKIMAAEWQANLDEQRAVLRRHIVWTIATG